MTAVPLLTAHSVTRWRQRLRRDGGGRQSVRGKILLVTALAISPTVLFASGVALQHVYGASGFLHAAAWMTTAAVPVLTGAAAVIIVTLAAEGLILRWLVYLERVAKAYGRGRYSIRPRRLEQAPAEFRAVGAAISDMATGIEDRDHALRIALEEQSVLLREVHHRVKNNLQIVASLLSLQAARTDDPTVQAALRDALIRIDTLALSQRFMKPTETKDSVHAAELFGALANQLRSRLRGRPGALSLTLDVPDLILDLEFASRLALIAGEAILLASHRAGGVGLQAKISLACMSPETLRLELTAQSDKALFAAEDGGVSTSLIDGYLRQIQGRIDRAVAGSPRMTVLAPL